MHATDLATKRCQPCEGLTACLTPDEVHTVFALAVPQWTVDADAKRIRRKWTTSTFAEAVAFIDRIAALAESEQHHPDLHLTGYRQLTVELTTHAIGGLSENDFILAAKIDELPPPKLHKHSSQPT